MAVSPVMLSNGQLAQTGGGGGFSASGLMAALGGSNTYQGSSGSSGVASNFSPSNLAGGGIKSATPNTYGYGGSTAIYDPQPVNSGFTSVSQGGSGTPIRSGPVQKLSGGAPTPQQQAASQAAATAAQAAAVAKATQMAQLQTNENNAMNTTLGVYGTGFGDSAATSLQSQAADYLAKAASMQSGVNNSIQNAQNNRQLGIRDLANTLRAGLASGAIALGNSNALDSSAAQNMARAYGEYGDNQQNDINANANMALTQAAQTQKSNNEVNQGDMAALGQNRANTLAQIQGNLALYLKELDATYQGDGLAPLNYAPKIQDVINGVGGNLQGIIGNTQTQLANNPDNQQITPQQAAAIALHQYTQNALPTNLSGYTFNNQPMAATNQNTAPTVQLPLYTNKYIAG